MQHETTADTADLRARQHAVLMACDLLDLPGDAELDAVVRVAAAVAGTTTATINLMDTERQCQLGAVGFVGRDSPRDQSICTTTSRMGRVFSSADLSADPAFVGNPFVDGRVDRLRQYASAPLVVDDVAIGTLCVFAPEVRVLDQSQLDRLEDLATVVVALIERRRESRRTAELAQDSEAARIALAAAHEQLGEARAFDGALLDALPVGVVAARADGRLTLFNRTSREWHGVDGSAGVPLADVAAAYHLFEADGTTPMPVDRVPLAGALAAGVDEDHVEMVIAPPGLPARTVECTSVAVHDAGGRLIGAVAVMADVTAQRELERQLRRSALHDALTGLPNRLLLVDRLEHALWASSRASGEVAVLFCDLDGFKAINDEHGHAAGDDVLRAAARRLGQAVRPGDTVGRIGGDEFVVVCPHVGSAADAQAIADRIEVALGAPVRSSAGTEHRVGVSIGVTLAVPGATPETLLTAADEAMYRVKNARRLLRTG